VRRSRGVIGADEERAEPTDLGQRKGQLERDGDSRQGPSDYCTRRLAPRPMREDFCAIRDNLRWQIELVARVPEECSTLRRGFHKHNLVITQGGQDESGESGTRSNV
jgi:hypothetical protein